mgnify:FL=1
MNRIENFIEGQSNAQGDIYLRQVESIPETAQRVSGVNGQLILGHSESGHDHAVCERPGVELYQDPSNGFRAFLKIALTPVALQAEPADLVHHKTGPDAHPTIRFPAKPGNYEILRQQEFARGQWVRAAD